MRIAAVLSTILITGLAGCVWTQFDDLKDDVWVDSFGGIGGSAKYGEELMEAMDATNASGATVAVLGRNAAQISGLIYAQDGTRDTRSINLVDVIEFVQVFDEHPVVASDPDSSQFAFAALTGAAQADPQSRGLKLGVFDATFDGLAYEPTAAGFPGLAANHTAPTAMAFGVTTVPPGEAMVSRRDQLLHVVFSGLPGAWAGCSFNPGDDEAAWGIAYGDVTGDLVDEWVIASAPIGVDVAPDPGRIWYFSTPPTDVTGATDCPTPGAAEVLVSGTGGTDFPFGPGTYIAIANFGAGPRVLVTTPGTSGRISIINFTGATPAFTQIIGAAVADLGPIAVADVAGDGADELVIGAPSSDESGKTGAGAVRVLTLNAAEDAVMVDHVLHDADPKQDQHFGKSLLVVPFGPPANGDNIIMVGAEGEVFTYFRTAFYDDVRDGR